MTAVTPEIERAAQVMTLYPGPMTEAGAIVNARAAIASLSLVTDAMIDAAAFALCEAENGTGSWNVVGTHIQDMWRADAYLAISAAIRAALGEPAA